MEYNTEHIDQYLNGELSEPEVKAFEQKMRADKDFAYEVQLQDAAIQVIQYPNFMKDMRDLRNEIAEEESKTDHKEETPVVTMKPKRSRIRQLLSVAASLLLIALAYFIFQKFQPPATPMAMTSTKIINILGGGTKGENTTKTPLQQGIEHFENKEYQTAIPLFDQVIRENPNRRAEAQFLKADALHRLKRKEEARAVLQSIKQSDKEQLYNKAQSILENYK